MTKKASARLVKGKEIYVWVIDKCPYCGKQHTHGGGNLDGDPDNYLGHRVAQCVGSYGQDDGYILVKADQ